MSETTPAIVPVTAVLPYPKMVEDGDKFFELQTFDKAKAGFYHYSVQFKTSDALIAHFSKEGVDGAEVQLALANRQIAFSMRSKAGNKLPADEDARKAMLLKGENLLITVEEARIWAPGERDVNSLSGLTKKINELKVELKAAVAVSDIQTATAKREQLKVMVAKLQELALSES